MDAKGTERIFDVGIFNIDFPYRLAISIPYKFYSIIILSDETRTIFLVYHSLLTPFLLLFLVFFSAFEGERMGSKPSLSEFEGSMIGGLLVRMTDPDPAI